MEDFEALESLWVQVDFFKEGLLELVILDHTQNTNLLHAFN